MTPVTPAAPSAARITPSDKLASRVPVASREANGCREEYATLDPPIYGLSPRCHVSLRYPRCGPVPAPLRPRVRFAYSLPSAWRDYIDWWIIRVRRTSPQQGGASSGGLPARLLPE